MILTDDFPPQRGGVATWTAAIVSGLRAAGDEVEVYARAREGLNEAVGVRGPSFGRWGGAWLAMRSATRLARADAVLATTWPAATWVSRFPGLARKLHVVAHGSDITRPTWSPQSRQRVVGRAAHRWAVSRFLANQMTALGHPCSVLPAPVDVAPRRSRSVGLKRLVGVGRAVETKGGERFVRLVAALGCSGVWIGEGPCLSRWRELSTRLGADVTFPGERTPPECRAAMAVADLAVLLPRACPDGSGQEGLGLVLLEAAACATPTLGCRIGGVPEAVGPGLIVREPDDTEAVVERLCAWWTPDRGVEAQEWLTKTHGTQRAVEMLRAAVC